MSPTFARMALGKNAFALFGSEAWMTCTVTDPEAEAAEEVEDAVWA